MSLALQLFVNLNKVMEPHQGACVPCAREVVQGLKNVRPELLESKNHGNAYTAALSAYALSLALEKLYRQQQPCPPLRQALHRSLLQVQDNLDQLSSDHAELVLYAHDVWETAEPTPAPDRSLAEDVKEAPTRSTLLSAALVDIGEVSLPETAPSSTEAPSFHNSSLSVSSVAHDSATDLSTSTQDDLPSAPLDVDKEPPRPSTGMFLPLSALKDTPGKMGRPLGRVPHEALLAASCHALGATEAAHPFTTQAWTESNTTCTDTDGISSTFSQTLDPPGTPVPQRNAMAGGALEVLCLATYALLPPLGIFQGGARWAQNRITGSMLALTAAAAGMGLYLSLWRHFA